MKEFYDAIYLSPHLDDAALSCGGQINDLSATGKSVLVVTLMAGRPDASPASQYVHSLHQRWQLEGDAVQARREEDIAACEVLGSDWQHWNFLDCIYRVDPETKKPFYTSDKDIFGEINPAESNLVNVLVEKMSMLPNCSRLFLPLTLGHHVDHQLTRRAAECRFSAPILHYYEDYPYARQFSAEQFATQQVGNWQSYTIELSEHAISARIQAIKCYKSQVSSFFKSDKDLDDQLRSHINTLGGERNWQRLEKTS